MFVLLLAEQIAGRGLSRPASGGVGCSHHLFHSYHSRGSVYTVYFLFTLVAAAGAVPRARVRAASAVMAAARCVFNEQRQPVSSPNVQLPPGVRLSEVERQLLAAGWLSPPEYVVFEYAG